VRGRGGFVLFALPAFLPSVIFSFFTQNRRGEGGADRPRRTLLRLRKIAYAYADAEVKTSL